MIARHLKLKMNRKLKKQLDKMLWNLTGVYNWSIKTIELRKNLSLKYSEFDILNLTAGHAQKCGVGSRAIHGAVHDAYDARKKCWSRQNGKPHLKSYRNKLNSILFRGDCKLDMANNKINLPNLGNVNFHSFGSGLPQGKLAAQVRLIKKASGWYAVVLFENNHTQKNK